MDTVFVRPQISHLVFQLFGRSLHPELFEFVSSYQVRRDTYQATVHLTECGHVISWQHDDTCFCEVTSSQKQPLPRNQRLIHYPLRGEQNADLRNPKGAIYQMNFQLEHLDSEVFWYVQNQLSEERVKQGLYHRFQTSNRITAGPLSLIHVEPRSRSLLVQTFHTFPEEHAIVKTQSLFEI